MKPVDNDYKIDECFVTMMMVQWHTCRLSL